jgi:hypothetical protein
MQTFHPTPETQTLIAEYQREYKRTTGKDILVTIRYGWLTINGGKYRLKRLQEFIDRLKSRPSFDLTKS